MSEFNPAPAQGKKHSYQKLGGWLLCAVILFFMQFAGCLALQFGEGGMMDVIRRWDMLIGIQGILLIAGQAFAMLAAVTYVFTAFAIIQRDPHFLRTRQRAFALAAANLLLQLVFGLLYGFAENARLFLLLQAAGYALLLVLVMRYYTRSARVRAYMGSDEYLRLALFTKRALKKMNGGDSK